MTKYEKQKELIRFCNHQTICVDSIRGKCPLYDFAGCISRDDENDVNERYEALVNSPQYVKFKEIEANEKKENPVEVKPVDMVNHPPHYTREGSMECIDEMVLIFGKEAVKNFCVCNAWKYRYRSADKNGIEDIKKSDWYLKKYKELCS